MKQLSLLEKNKKGMLGLDLAKETMLMMVVLVAIAVVGLLVVINLRDSGIFTTNSQSYNDTSNIANNYSAGIQNFFKNVPTIFTILFVVVLVSILAVVIYTVSRFGGGASGGL